MCYLPGPYFAGLSRRITIVAAHHCQLARSMAAWQFDQVHYVLLRVNWQGI